MGTYDTRGGAPISPRVDEPAITDREEEVLEVLEELDAARNRAKAVLRDVFLDLVRKRYPIGSVVDISRVSFIRGSARGATLARVVDVFEPAINWSRPESSRVAVDCITLRKDGTETGSIVGFHEPVLTREYELGAAFDDSPLTDRDQLVRLIHQMEQAAEVEPDTGVDAAPEM